MARSRLTEPTDDLIQDSGAVLWSFVRGEQLEFPVILPFINDVTAGYEYEAVVVEAKNVINQEEKPTEIETDGAQTTLVIRLPVKRGTWDPAQAYNREEVVLFNNKYYKLLSGIARVNSLLPSVDSAWQETQLNKLYLQFPKTLASDWNIEPTVGHPVYGFFELRVTEGADAIYQRTWKPVRGMVEVLFSPTEYV